MLRFVVLRGVQYAGETVEEMDRRERAMLAHNRRIDAQQARDENDRRRPLPSCEQWAIARGLWKPLGARHE